MKNTAIILTLIIGMLIAFNGTAEAGTDYRYVSGASDADTETVIERVTQYDSSIVYAISLDGSAIVINGTFTTAEIRTIDAAMVSLAYFRP